MEPPPVQYVTTSDGYSVAYCVSGVGPPLILLPKPLYSMYRFWGSALTRAWLERLLDRHRLVQYDIRTQGLSRPHIDADFSIAAHGRDLKAVADHVGLDRFVLLAWSGFGHVAVRFAVANADRVRALILVACPVSGRAWPRALFDALAKEDWEVFIRSQLPTGLSKEETLRELKLIRDSMTQQGSMEGMRVALDSSLEDALALLQVPTLVMHPRDYVTLRSSESMKLAASISGARMVMTDGYDIFDDAGQGIQAIETFLEELPSEQQSESAAVVGQNRLSSREHEVLRLIARGLSNQQMADELVISVRTVERHINHIYEKIGVHNRAQAAAYAVSHRSVAR